MKKKSNYEEILLCSAPGEPISVCGLKTQMKQRLSVTTKNQVALFSSSLLRAFIAAEVNSIFKNSSDTAAASAASRHRLKALRCKRHTC